MSRPPPAQQRISRLGTGQHMHEQGAARTRTAMHSSTGHTDTQAHKPAQTHLVQLGQQSGWGHAHAINGNGVALLELDLDGGGSVGGLYSVAHTHARAMHGSSY